MYDELVKQLRELPHLLFVNLHGHEDVVYKAADAIEELSKPRWIPVTERLPKQRINQNTLDFEYVLCATTFGDVRPFKYGRRIGQGDAHFWNGAGYVDAYVTHWMHLPQPPKEET